MDGGSMFCFRQQHFRRGRGDLNRIVSQASLAALLMRGGMIVTEIEGFNCKQPCTENWNQGPKGYRPPSCRGLSLLLLHRVFFVQKIRALEFNKIFIAFGAAVRSLNFDEHSCYSDVSMVLRVDSGSNKLDFSQKDWGGKAQ